MRDVDYGRDTGDHARQQIYQADAALDWNTGVPRPARAEADRIQRAADDRSMQQNVIRKQYEQKDWKLRWNHGPQITLAEREKSGGETAVIHRRLGNPLGDTAKQRERAERHN